MRIIFVNIFVLLSFICYSQNKNIQYIKSTSLVEKNTAFYFNTNILRSVDAETDLYLVWIKTTPFKDKKIETIRKIQSFYRFRRIKSNNINSFYYSVQLYLVDIYLDRYKVMSNKILYDILGTELMSEDIDAFGNEWNYCSENDNMFDFLIQIKKYIKDRKL